LSNLKIKFLTHVQTLGLIYASKHNSGLDYQLYIGEENCFFD